LEPRGAFQFETVHILAAVAEHDREMISERTKAELNRGGVKTACGGKWAHVQVGMILARSA
jgi:hypothetical protein